MDGEPSPEPKQENPDDGAAGDAPPAKTIRRGRRKLREFEHDGAAERLLEGRKDKGAFLAARYPSYGLGRGVGIPQFVRGNLRKSHRKKLWRVLSRCVRVQNWPEASGVLSVLIQGTVGDKSVPRNRAKYLAALELLGGIKGESVGSRRVQSVYELWMKKIGALKNWTTKHRFAVELEWMITCLQRGSVEDAHQAATRLMQNRGFDSDPVANFVVGLAFCELWYSTIPKELQLTKQDSSVTCTKSEIPGANVHMPMEFSKEIDDLEAGRANTTLQCDSNTSVACDKEVDEDDTSQQRESMDVDDKVKKETSSTSFQPQEDHLKSNEWSGNSYHSSPSFNGDLPHASIFFTQGLPPWLLPIKLPSSHENLEDAIYKHRKLHTNYYTSALKHLRVALHSTQPVIEAFHPLIQMLLLGDQVHDAINELENSLHSSSTVVQLRLKSNLLEHFDSGNFVKLSTCFEDILKKDPTCSDSLARLVIMHKRRDYDSQNLVEMIALHLDASCGICETWQELASCFLNLSLCEGDRVSTRGVIDRYNQGYLGNSNKIPEIFTKSESGKAWRLRARWWLKRHFHDNILMSDIASGDLKLLAYKAAAASHIYGRHFKYVVKATECIEKEDDMELYSSLQKHILNSIGFYPNKRNTC